MKRHVMNSAQVKMTKFGKTAQEFIQSSFSPISAVLCSQNVDYVVSKNNLSLPELLQPFTALETDGQLREPGGSVCTVKNWKIIVRDINWKPLPPTEARRQLNNAVLHNYSDKTVPIELDGGIFDVPKTTNWFDAWRETYLEVQFPSDHEFTKHFISCIIVAAAHEENVIDSFNHLNQQYAQLQNVAPPKLPKWFNNGVLKSYLLVHDVSIMPKERAETVFDTLKQNFGASSCFMLSINSKSTLDPNVQIDLWSQFVKRSSETSSDKSSSLTNLAPTPVEPQPSGTIIEGEDNAIFSSFQDNVHPLTNSENDFYDNANSLQTHSFSGSVESVNVSAKGLDLSTEVHGAALNSSDIDAIKQFMQDYAFKALLPYLEKLISQLSDLVANRKGVSRSLLSATKRWFGTGKVGNTTGNNTVVYTSDCPELQLRRLGDLWFLCGQWQRAFDTYHTAKREFYADSAWLCYAGALEMAAISSFMAGEANRKTHGYMEESIVTYLNTCRMVQYAVRASLLSTLCLTSCGLHGEAAKQLIRMTSEDSDLRSAMLLEQAALCFLSGPGSKAMCRKYAFHMVLSGHRFTKAGQKKHAYRCYKQAYQVYCGRGWRLASDHVQFALGRLAGSLRIPREAIQWLVGPLAPVPPQPPHQQDAFLREYMLAHQLAYSSNPMHSTEIKNESDEKTSELALLPLPVVEQRAIATLCCGPAPLSSPRRLPASSLSVRVDVSNVTQSTSVDDASDSRRWRVLEEMLLQVTRGSVPMIFKPTVDLYTDNTDCEPVVPQGEPIQISITLWNPLKISLILKDVELLWRFTPRPNDLGFVEEYCNEPAISSGKLVDTTVIVGQKHQSILLEADCTKTISFTLTPLRVGQLNVQALSYKLVNAGEGGNEKGGNTVMIQGKANLISGNKSADKRLNITVIPEAPCLQMTFSETDADIMSGEMRTVDVEFTNVGPVDMKNLHIAVSHPDCISFVTAHDDADPFQKLYDNKYRAPPQYSDERSVRSEIWRSEAARHVRLVSDCVVCGTSLRSALHIRARSSAPLLHILAYYETGVSARPYRLLRHVFRFTPTEVVDLYVTPTRSLRAVQNTVYENINLAIEVKNISTENVCVEILEASLLSRQWKLTSLTATRDNCEALKSREQVHLVLRAQRLLENLPEGKVEHSCVKVAKRNSNSIEDVTASPYSRFIMNYKPSYIDSPDTSNVQDIANKKKGLIQSMFILRWKAHNTQKGTSAIGQHCLWLECFTKIQSWEKEVPLLDKSISLQLDEYDSKKDLSDEKQNKQDNIVIFRMEHSDKIQHDFNEKKLCIVPVTMNIVNCYGVPVKVFINISKQKNRESCSELGWAGTLSSVGDSKDVGVSVNLEKFETRCIPMRGLCAAPGTYLVGSAFKVTTQADDENLNVTNVSNNTSLLVVQQTTKQHSPELYKK